MMNISRNFLNDPRAELECYWEYAALQPERVMDDFDTKLTKICSRINGETIVLDMAAVPSSFVRCAARLLPNSDRVITVVGDALGVQVMLCNMSPLVLSITGVTVRFTNYEIGDVIINPPSQDDILPGTLVEFSGLVYPSCYGNLSIESITVDFVDLPLRLFFPVVTLATNEANGRASWGDITTSWPFIRRLEQYTEVAHIVAVEPIRPTVQYKVWLTRPLVARCPCPIEISLDNQHSHLILCTLRFSNGPVEANVVMQESLDGVVTSRLADFSIRIECPPAMVTLKTVYINFLDSPPNNGIDTFLSFSLRMDCNSFFSPDELVQYGGKTLTTDGIFTAIETLLSLVSPFKVTLEMVPLPTDTALDPIASPLIRRDLVRHLVYITVMATLPTILSEWRLIGPGDVNFKCLWPQKEHDGNLKMESDGQVKTEEPGGGEIKKPSIIKGHHHPKDDSNRDGGGVELMISQNSSKPENDKGIELEPGDSYTFLFDLCDQPEYGDCLEGLWQPIFKLKWSLVSFPKELGTFHHILPAVALRSHSIFIIPNPDSSPRLGKPASLTWLVWNMTDNPHDVTIRIEPVEECVYMGPKLVRNYLDPLTCIIINGTFIPLRPGKVRLPTLLLRPANQGDSIIYETLARSTPFVQL